MGDLALVTGINGFIAKHVAVADSGYVTTMTGVRFRPAREALIAAAGNLIEHGVVQA